MAFLLLERGTTRALFPERRRKQAWKDHFGGMMHRSMHSVNTNLGVL